MDIWRAQKSWGNWVGCHIGRYAAGFSGKIDSKEKRKIIRAQAEVIRVCASRDIPVVVLEYKGHGRTLDKLNKEIFCVKRVVRIIKRRDDGFSRTSLHRRLRKLKVGSLLFMGVNASHCVLDTARSAQELGYQVVTASTLTTNACLCCQYRRTQELDLTFKWFTQNGYMLPSTPREFPFF